jgi:hypothetical protein
MRQFSFHFSEKWHFKMYEFVTKLLLAPYLCAKLPLLPKKRKWVKIIRLTLHTLRIKFANGDFSVWLKLPTQKKNQRHFSCSCSAVKMAPNFRAGNNLFFDIIFEFISLKYLHTTTERNKLQRTALQWSRVPKSLHSSEIQTLDVCHVLLFKFKRKIR